MNKITMQEFEGVYSYVEEPQMQVEVILASQGPNQKPIYTIRMRYPRIIHGEIMTHRFFSRNARSSRAVPVKTMLLECTSIPFIPWHWGKNQKGMQAGDDCDELLFIEWTDDHWENREDAWLLARDTAVNIASAYMTAGYHKQIPNRLLEPFSWIDTLITTTDLDNFLWLRQHEAAEPHLQDLANLMAVAVENCEIQELNIGQWHIPYVTNEDYNELPLHKGGLEVLLKVSAARCAWISYKPFGGQENTDYEREMKTYDMLLSSDRVHASPFEHQATPDEITISTTSTLVEDGVVGDSETNWKKPHLHGNLNGYIQYRKLIPNECYVKPE